MKKMSIGVGVLVLLGMLLALMGVLYKVTTFNLLAPYLNFPRSFFLIANTCLLLALVIDRFEPED
jgi:hypothetical protein